MGSSTPGLTRHSNKMKRLTEEIGKLNSARWIITQRLDQDIRDTTEKTEEEAQKFFGLKERPTMGGWSCKESPNGLCWYAAEDRYHDDCIICHDPSERK
jgi:hypothetical protein